MKRLWKRIENTEDEIVYQHKEITSVYVFIHRQYFDNQWSVSSHQGNRHFPMYKPDFLGTCSKSKSLTVARNYMKEHANN